MRRTILLADDSPTIQRLVTNTFADLDFEIVSVSNGEAAIKKFDEIHPNVVLADIYMPGKDGYEVCAHIREHPQRSETPVVLLVGAFDAFKEDRARECRATDHITKPFEPSALIAMVQAVLPPEEVEEAEVVATRREEPRQPARPAAPAETHQFAHESSEDLLGLAHLFSDPAPPPAAVSEGDVDRIAERVIQRLSKEVVESIAWEIVPDIAEKIVREESRKAHEG